METITTASSLKLREKIGGGGCGEVWRAVRVSGGIEQEVAVKVLKADASEQEEFVHRLRDEARLLARLKHSSIVKMMDFSIIDGKPAVIMEFVEGANLGRLMELGPVPLRTVVQVGVDVASAMVEAHSLSHPSTGHSLMLIHRDLKPENIQLTPRGEVKLLDFGIAKATFEGREAQTGTQKWGTQGYIPPERMILQDLQAGDVFSLAVVLAEARIGRRLGACPSPAEDLKTWVASHKRWQEMIRKALAGNPEKFIALILQSTTFDPAQRPTMLRLEEELDGLMERAEGDRLKVWAPAALRSLAGRDAGKVEVAAEIGPKPLPDTLFGLGKTKAGDWWAAILLMLGAVGLVVVAGAGFLLWAAILRQFSVPEVPADEVVPVTAPVAPAAPPVVAPITPPVKTEMPEEAEEEPVVIPEEAEPEPVVVSVLPPPKKSRPKPDPKPPMEPPAPETPIAAAPTRGAIVVEGAEFRRKDRGSTTSAMPGTYTIEIRFPSGWSTELVQVRAGETTRLKCNMVTEVCK